MSPLSTIKFISLALRSYCWWQHHHFLSSLSSPKKAQTNLLKRILQDLAHTEYGKSNKITGMEDYEGFAAKLPIQTYASFQPWLDHQLNTPDAIITPHKIIHWEPTSGSQGTVKMIPYTKPLLNSFSRMFQIWVYDLLKNVISLETGRTFMSISPTLPKVGFADDTTYLSPPLRFLVAQYLVSPVSHDQTNYMETLALRLLEEKDLEIISIWSPVYLLNILDYISDQLKTGCENIWPKLKFISCWDQGFAQEPAQLLRHLFPHTTVQGKGLLATEAPITLPLSTSKAPIPLVNDVFCEFETESGQLKQLHQLNDGETYRLIITQRSGLTRYRLEDIVQVLGFLLQTPCLIFKGRDKTCDLVGEKLTEIFIQNVLAPLLPGNPFLLLPWRDGKQGYKLFVEHKTDAEAEKALCQSYHYALARKLGQLEALQVFHIPHLQKRLTNFFLHKGIKLGNIKLPMLITDLNLSQQIQSFFNDCLSNT